MYVQAWTAVSPSLGSDQGLQTFCDTISAEYCRVCNDVLQKKGHKSAAELKVAIDEQQYGVDLTSPNNNNRYLFKL